MSAGRRGAAIVLLKALVTGACLWWLSRYLELDRIHASLAGVNPALVLFAVALHLLSYLAGGVRWWLLFRHLVPAVQFRQVWPSYYLGVFFNNVLPSAYGGDLARTARLYMSGMSGGALVGSALIDRLLGLAAVIAMGSIALVFTPQESVNQLGLITFGLAALVLIPAAVIMIAPRWAKMLDSGYGTRWPRLHAVFSCFPRYRTAPGLILKAFGLSVLNQLLVVVVFLMLAPGTGVHVPVFQFTVVLMLVFLVTSLPISLGGLGPREGALMSLLMPLGAQSNAILALSVVYLLVLWSAALPGVFMLMLREPGTSESSI